jgi:hypothetical protein
VDRRCELRARGEEWPRCRGVAEFLEDDGLIDPGHAKAADFGGECECGPVEAGEGVPEVGRVVALVDDPSHVGGRTLFVEDLADSPLELALVVVEFEVHASQPRSRVISKSMRLSPGPV